MMEQPTDSQRRKQEIRKEARDRRGRQQNAEHLSRHIFDQLAKLPQYGSATTVMSYMSFHSEVSTQEFVARAWKDGKRVVIPYCVEDRLGLFHLQSFEDLTPGMLGILEPKAELRGHTERCVGPEKLDLIAVPGLAFDRQCGRVGYGKGYYDRLLHQVRAETAVVAVAFQCQIFPEIPVLPYDVRVDKVITESAVYVRSQPRWDGTKPE